MDTIKVNPAHVSDIKTKEVVFSGVINDYSGVQTDVNAVICIAPYAMKLTSFTIRAQILETTAGTVDVKKVASETVIGSATDMVMQLLPTAAGGLVAATNYNMELVATEASYTVAAGDLVVLMIGTTGELTGLAYLAVFERLS